jgi:hypothetical protein
LGDEMSRGRYKRGRSSVRIADDGLCPVQGSEAGPAKTQQGVVRDSAK